MSDNLSLKDFIKEALLEICNAVEEVRKDKSYVAKHTSTTAGSEQATHVEFDIAVSVTDTKSKTNNDEQRVGISVLKIGAGVDKKKEEGSESTNSKVSRIKFSVPVFF